MLPAPPPRRLMAMEGWSGLRERASGAMSRGKERNGESMWAARERHACARQGGGRHATARASWLYY